MDSVEVPLQSADRDRHARRSYGWDLGINGFYLLHSRSNSVLATIPPFRPMTPRQPVFTDC